MIGRKKELKILQDSYTSSRSEIIAIYGRRRIGKSYLIEYFGRSCSFFWSFEGIEDASSEIQFSEFSKDLLPGPLHRLPT